MRRAFNYGQTFGMAQMGLILALGHILHPGPPKFDVPMWGYWVATTTFAALGVWAFRKGYK